MKVLITGGTGLLGYNLQQASPPDLTVTSVYHPNEYPLQHTLPFSAHPLDITKHSVFSSFFKSFKPDVLIHTAAQGSLDWCEENKEKAFNINVISTKNIIHLCEEHHTHFIFMSSNAIYNGRRTYSNEETPPSPLNYYGTMKVIIENYLTEQNLSYTILRSNLMYGWPYPDGRDNQVTRVVSSLRSKEPISIVNDTYFSPLSASFMSEVIWRVTINKINGTYNIGGADRMNLFELSQLTAEIFSLDPSYLTPISHENTSANARRAIDTSFDSSLMQSQLNFSPLSVIDGLRAMKVNTLHAIPSK